MANEKQDFAHLESVAAAPTATGIEEGPLPLPPDLASAQEGKLWRKMDLRLLPILSVMYLMAFMDRANIGNAKLEGLETQLHLHGYDFNIALLVFFIPFIIFESPSNLLLRKFRPSRWLPFLMVTQGVTMIFMGLSKFYTMLVINRVMLGVAEAGLFPGISYYLTSWYPRDKLQLRISLFFGSASLAGAFSGILAYGINFMSGLGHLLGWSWIFILDGIITVVVGVIARLVIVDSPATAKFLTPEQRAFVLHRKKVETAGFGEEEHLEMRHVWAALADWQVWTQGLILLTLAVPLYGISFFLPSIIKDFGYSAAATQLLTIPPYLVGTIAVYVTGYYSDKLKWRYPFILGGFMSAFMGLSLNVMKFPVGVKYLGTFAIVAGTYSAVPGTISWLGNNLCGQSKRCVGMALHISVANFGGIFASLIYRSKDSPRYLIGHGISSMFVTIGLITVLIVVFVYKRINRKREQILCEMQERGEYLSPEEIRCLGDRSPTFRYII